MGLMYHSHLNKYAGLTKIMCYAYVSLSAEKYAGFDVISPKLNAEQALHQTVSHTFLPRNIFRVMMMMMMMMMMAKMIRMRKKIIEVDEEMGTNSTNRLW